MNVIVSYMRRFQWLLTWEKCFEKNSYRQKYQYNVLDKLTNSVSFVFHVRQNRIFPDYQTSDYCILVRGRFKELDQIEFR